MAKAGRPEPRGDTTSELLGLLGGAALLWLNPKAWTMAVAASAAYAALLPDLMCLAGLLALVFGVAAAISLSVWCAFGLLLARALRTDGQWRIANISLRLALAASILPMWL